MRVLLFRGLCDTGGVSTSMCLHGAELRRRGIDVEFWFCEASVRIPDFQRIATTHVTPPSQLLDAVNAGRYDVVHVVTTDPTAELLTFATRRPRIVATNRGGLSALWQSTNCFARTAVSRGMAALDQPLTDLQVDAIPNSIDAARFALNPGLAAAGAPIVAWVGRTTSIEQKDFPRFLRVGALLARHGVRLWVADAHGSDWSWFERRGYSRPPIERWEQVSQQEMPGFYQAVAASGGVLLMTSPAEGFGLAAAESAACGALTVAPDVVGLREAVIDGVTGSLYPRETPDAELADRIRSMLATTVERRRTASDAARQEFSVERMSGRYLDVYQRPAPVLYAGPAAWPADDPTVRLLRERMATYEGYRVYLLTTEAVRFARERRRSLAMRAIARAFHVSPRLALRRKSAARIARALLSLARPATARPAVA